MARLTPLTRTALTATAHCFTGCAIGEVVGLAAATALGWGNPGSIALAVVFAFVFGYGLTLASLRRSGMEPRAALGVALAADTVSISVIVDNTIVAAVPGAMAAGLGDGRFWWSLALGLALAFAVALPVNRALIARGRGHAAAHAHH